MLTKKPPQKPTNLRPYPCKLTVNNQHLTILEIVLIMRNITANTEKVWKRKKPRELR
jgi:hypothetical protein